MASAPEKQWRPAIGTPVEQLPFRTGTILLTDQDRTFLRTMGWKEGDPLPTNLPDLIKQIQLEVNAAQEDAMEPGIPEGMEGRKPLKVDVLRPDQIPEDKRRELMDALAMAKVQRQEYLEGKASMPKNPGGPGVTEAIVAAREAERSARLQTARPVAATPDPTSGQKWPSPPAPKTANIAPPPVASSEEQTEVLPTAQGECPFCGFDLSHPKPSLDISPEDKLQYIVAIRGGKRFRKEYTLFDGSITVRFRGLTVEETDLARAQITADIYKDAGNKTIHEKLDYDARLLLYITCLSLEYISSFGREIPHLNDWPAEILGSTEAPDTTVKNYVSSITKHVLPTESVRRVVVQSYTQFSMLQQQLEVRARDPNFFRATRKPT